MKNLVFIIVLCTIFSECNINLPELKEIQFNDKAKFIYEKYKLELEPEIMQINPGYIRFDTIEKHRININILNAKNIPESEEELNKLASNIAYDFYSSIQNKDDFSEFVITIIKQSSFSTGNVKMKNIYPVSFEEIEKMIEKKKNENAP